MQLPGRVALITGSKRIGGVTALELAKRGADVALVCRSSCREAEGTAQRVRESGQRAVVLEANLEDPTACERVVDHTVGAFGRVDVLVNMASRYRKVRFDDLTIEDWDAQMAIDLRSTWLCARAVVPYMRELGGGRIVNVSDWTARSGRPRYAGYLPYYVAKAGVIALTEALALELASDNILVNAVAPGPIVAPVGTTSAELSKVARLTPLGRWGGEEEIAKAVLAFVDNDFMTGETVRVDGGRHLR